MTEDLPEWVKQAWHGIDLCRQDQWEEGLNHLRDVAASPAVKGQSREAAGLPGRFYSYLGYGLARYEKRYSEGLELCKTSVRVEFDEAENYLYLAKTYLLMGNRSPAVATIRRGLKVDPGDPSLRALQEEIGERLSPLLPFLSRSHPLNHGLGRIRARLYRLIPWGRASRWR